MALMSVILITPDNYATIAKTMHCLENQTLHDQLEIVIVAPSNEQLQMDKSIPFAFDGVRIVEIGPLISTAEARAAGIRQATTPIVALTEDHSFPEPRWAEALVRAHQQKWAAVGPAVSNGNPLSLTSWANFVIEYGEWLYPAKSGSASHLPGHNSSYKRAVLLNYGDELSRFLESESLLHWDLISKGYSLFLESDTVTRHLNYSDLSSSISLRFYCGRLFAGSRMKQWGSLTHYRSIYCLGSPLIPGIRLGRIIRKLKVSGWKSKMIFSLVPILSLFLIIDAVGELTGYLFGMGDAMSKISDIDFHRERFMNRRDKKCYAVSV
jgi:hypothetical protein